MQLKHPEILYFLFLLVIPILVHLFQLRRFKKEYFTNVRFLKQITIQTRKSSKIKKWLLLVTRLLLLACLIIAFAQPFFRAKDIAGIENEMVIFLDNSYSMQAKGDKGELLKRAIQDLLENTPETQKFSLLTNTDAFWDTDIKSIHRDLQNVSYNSAPFRPDLLLSKTTAKKQNTAKDIIVITDAVGLSQKNMEGLNTKNTYFINPKAQNKNNISIDSVYIHQQLDDFYEVNIVMQAYGEKGREIPLAIYNGKSLVAKTLVIFDTDKKTSTFSIPKKDFHGYAEISDNSLAYDNTYYFSISKPEKSNVISIGESNKNKFLFKIYTEDEFNFTAPEITSLDYNIIEKQDAVILNELKEIPQALSVTLKAFYDKGGNIIIIPSGESTLQNLNSFLSIFGNLIFKNIENSEKQITDISFSHPLYNNVFEKRITNFQYPKTEKNFELTGNVLPVIKYEDNAPFLASISNKAGNVYIFTAPLNKTNSNFQNSPLIVPTFNNMAQNSSNRGINAFIISKNQSILLDATLAKDEVATIKNETSEFIPLQQMVNNRIKLSFGDYPEYAGNYSILKKNEILKNVSFNHNRTESNLEIDNPDLISGYAKAENISSLFNKITSERTGSELWKWFVMAGLLFLLIEIFIQKFVK